MFFISAKQVIKINQRETKNQHKLNYNILLLAGRLIAG